MGTLTVEEIYMDRKKFAIGVREVAIVDLVNLGLEIVSYTIKDVKVRPPAAFVLPAAPPSSFP